MKHYSLFTLTLIAMLWGACATSIEPDTLTATPTALTFDSSGTPAQTITLTANVDWSVTQNGDWITVTPKSGKSSGTLTVSTTAHTATTQRIGSITLSNGTLTATLSVTQTGSTTTNGGKNDTTTKTIPKYTLTFDVNGGTGSIQPIVVDSGKTATTPTATQSGAVFAGWYTAKSSGTAYDFTKPVVANATLYAQYKYEVIYTDYRGVVFERDTVSAGSKPNKPSDPIRTDNHNTFGGWYTDTLYVDAFDFATHTLSAKTTLHAQWYTRSDIFTYSASGDTLTDLATGYENADTLFIPTQHAGKTLVAIGEKAFKLSSQLTLKFATIPASITVILEEGFSSNNELSQVVFVANHN